MKSFVFGALLAATAALSAFGGEITTTEAYAFTTPASGKAGAAYVSLSGGTESDRLIGATGDIAQRVEIHEHRMVEDVMRMRQVEGGIDLPAGGSIEMGPGGYHIMLMGLNQQLDAGQDFPLTLSFASGAEMVVTVTVKDRDAAAEGGHAGHSGHSGHAGHTKTSD